MFFMMGITDGRKDFDFIQQIICGKFREPITAMGCVITETADSLQQRTLSIARNAVRSWTKKNMKLELFL